MSDEYGPYLVLQSLPPLRLPQRIEPDSGLLLIAKPRDSYTQFAIEKEAQAAIRRDQENRGGEERVGLEIVLVSTWEAYRQSKLPRSQRQ